MAAIHAALRAFLREHVDSRLVYLDKEGASGSSNTRAWDSLSDDDRWFGAIIAARPSIDAWLLQVREMKCTRQSRVASKQILANRSPDRLDYPCVPNVWGLPTSELPSGN
jgi:hypothetical protein